MPFLENVGITSVWKNYNIAGAFLAKEDEDSYKWAIEQLVKMFGKVQRAPTCVVTDREKALMNALEKQFPEAKFILCRRHVRKNIEDFGKKAMDKFRGTTFSNDCMKLFKETTIQGYEASLSKLKCDWRKAPKCLQYLQQNWLDPYKERIVSIWTDTVFTLGTTTTNRFVHQQFI